MGTYEIAGNPHQLAYLYGARDKSKLSGAAWISIIDLTAAKQIAWLASPRGYGVEEVYFGYINGPAGEKHPFLAPGAHYLSVTANPTGAFQAPPWNFLCIFDRDYIIQTDPACYTGFKHYSTSFTTSEGVPDTKASGFRHGGGWVEDVDGDGWEDINLPFMRYILTISGRTGQQIALAHFDVAAQSEPNSPPYFHSGRFFGRFAAFVDPKTTSHYVLLTDGEGTGFFGGLYCGVSRYIALAQWETGPSLNLKWSHYLSFAKTIFNSPYDSITNVSRRGDDLNNCPHFFGTSLEWHANRPFVVFSLFHKNDPSPVCQAELLAEQKSHFNRAASVAYEAQCAPRKVPAAIGRWSIHILDALTGAEVATYPDEYVWGHGPNVLPGHPDTLLVQQFKSNGGDIAYNRTGASADSLTLTEFADGPSLTTIATIEGPLPTPIVSGMRGHGDLGGGPAYPRGIGSSYEGVSKLVTSDIDGDDLNDVKLSSGKWLGYSPKTGGLIVKVAPPFSSR